MKMHFVRERFEAGAVKLQFIPTIRQRALLTKNLPRPTFERLREELLDPAGLAAE